MEIIEHHRRTPSATDLAEGLAARALAWPEASWLAVGGAALVTMWGWQDRPSVHSGLHLLADLVLALLLIGHARRHRRAVRNAQEQVSEIEARTRWLDAVSGLSPNAVLVFERDAEGQLRLVFTNPAFSELFGLRPVELLGLSEAAADEWLAGLALDHTVMPPLELGETTFELAGPPPRVLRRSAREDRSQRVYYFHDVTHETAVERLKSEFLTTAAHELRTPMVSVYGFSELLLDDHLPPERRQRLNELVHRQAGVLKHLVDQLLELSQLDAMGHRMVQREHCELSDLVRLACQTAAAVEATPRVRVELAAHPLVIDGDSAKLQQALICLIGNALKYSRAPAPVLVRVVRREVAGQAVAEVSVSDRGIGMRVDQLSRARERFYRADPSGHQLGAGLGLPIAEAIVRAHQGQLTLASELGQGTCATITLPLVEADQDSAPAAQAEPALTS